MRWRKVSLIGVGLLGGSLGLALKRRALAQTIAGYVRRPASIQESLQRKVADEVSCDLAQVVKGADLLVLCTPIAQMKLLALRMVECIQPGAIVTDVGSVKTGIVTELGPLFSAAGAHFIGSHPMAGSEKMGVSAARPDLFDRAICVVTPDKNSPAQAVASVEDLWNSVGGRVLKLTPEQHDLLVSRSSHLPHLLAAQLASYVLAPDALPEQSMLCANGFRDTTRIASGSPEMWRDIALANRDFILRSLEEFSEGLDALKTLLHQGDPAQIEAFFNQAKQRRDGWIAQGVNSSE